MDDQGLWDAGCTMGAATGCGAATGQRQLFHIHEAADVRSSSKCSGCAPYHLSSEHVSEVGCHREQPESTQQLDHYILEAALLAGWVDPGALNFAAMTGLQPSTRYYYVVGDLVRSQRLPHMSSSL